MRLTTLLVDDEHEGGHLLDGELAHEARILVRIDTPHTQAVSFLALDVGEQALHPARGPGCRVREEDQHRKRRIAHYGSLLRFPAGRN